MSLLVGWPGGGLFGPGAGSSTDNAVPRWDTTSGTLLQDSGVIIDDSNNMSGINTLTMATMVATTTVTTGDNIVVLNDDVTGVPSENAGLEVERGTSTNVQVLWNETSDLWQAGISGSLLNVARMAEAVTDNAIARYSGTTDQLQNSGVTVDDSDNILMPTTAEIRLRDSEIRLYSFADGEVLLEADVTLKLNTTDGDTDIGNAGNTRIGSATNHVQISSTGVHTFVGTAEMGNLVLNRATSAGSPTLTSSDYYMGITDTSSARTVNLPALSAVEEGQVFIIKDESGAAGTNNITVDGSGIENIDGATTLVISTNYASITIVAGTTEWHRVSF